MALSAARQFNQGDALLKMLSLDFGLAVFVAAIAGIFCVCGQMTGLASHCPLSTVIQGEGVLRQKGRTPGLRSMAALAFQPKRASMNFWLGVTGYTFPRNSIGR